MIITKSWLNEWVDIEDKSVDDICSTLNQIGLEVDSAKSYQIPENIVVGFVLSCEKHPNADKLNICQVDIGTSTRQIVCGASNVREGIYVAVAMIGATMPNGMEIKPVKLRGVESDGMICAASELNLPDIGKGIMILDESIGVLQAGTDMRTFDILNDDVIEIELTANRGDCLSHQGVARDLAAAYGKTLKKQEPVDSDYRRQGTGRVMHLTHQNDVEADVIYKSFDYEGFSLPLRVLYRLKLIDASYTDALEAVLSYSTTCTGVVLRAYKHAFFEEENGIAEIRLGENKKGLTVVEGSQVATTVGIMQNPKSLVKKVGSKVILEASYINPEKISKEVYEKKLKTDDIFYRTSRGSDSDVKLGISMCADMLMKHCNVTFTPGTFEYLSGYTPSALNLNVDSINNQIGDSIEKAKIVKVLTALGFSILKSQDENIVVQAPRFRHDVVSEQDVVEEIVRMVGIDNITSKPLNFIEKNTYNKAYQKHLEKRKLRLKAVQEGFFESQSYLFVDKKKVQALGFETADDAIEISNPIVETMDTMRPTILPALIEAAGNNKRLGQKRVGLFEYGVVFDQFRDETMHMSFLYTGPIEDESLKNAGQPCAINFETFVQKIANVIGAFDLEAVTKLSNTLQHPYQLANIIVNGENVGQVFKLHPKVASENDLEDTFIAQLLIEKIKRTRIQAKAYSKYQNVQRDLSIVVPNTYTFSSIKSIIDGLDIDVLTGFNLVDSYTDESLGAFESITLRFTLQSLEKTLKDKDITSIMNSIVSGFKNEGYTLR